jgi:hypothetical protein
VNDASVSQQPEKSGIGWLKFVLDRKQPGNVFNMDYRCWRLDLDSGSMGNEGWRWDSVRHPQVTQYAMAARHL